MARGRRRRHGGVSRWLLTGIAVVAAVAAAATVVVLTGEDDSSDSAGTATSGLTTVYAPYVYMTLAGRPTLTQVAKKTGANALHLAFAITKGETCSLAWDGTTDLDAYDTEITAAMDAGLEVIVSSGGASGGEVAEACGDATETQAQLQKLLDLGVRYLDFDVEGETRVADATANKARAEAIAALQRKYSDLKVSFTLTAAPPTAADTAQGADNTAPWIAAVDAGVVIDRINLMTMNYGGTIAAQDMGAAAIAAATGLRSQIETIQGVESAEAWSMVGLTAMIGVNDVKDETFTLEDATSVADFVRKNGVGMLSYWSVGRDFECGADVTTQPSPNCSGVEQSDYAFASVFKAVVG